MAFELPSGRQLWFQPIYERPQPAFDYTAQGRYQWLLENLALVGRPQAAMPPSLSQSSAPDGGHLYLRPFYKRGRGVTIVSLETGKRRDVIISPHSEPLTAFGVDLPVFTIGPRGKMVAFGLSMRPERYVERKLGKSKVPVLSLPAFLSSPFGRYPPGSRFGPLGPRAPSRRTPPRPAAPRCRLSAPRASDWRPLTCPASSS